jgi:plastocyanin|tara:strand:+ start:344 stop:631 length:288 start_codon:yes stop_codon:yes gene_type:complete
MALEEKTAEEIAQIFSAAGDSVTFINQDSSYSDFVTRTGSIKITEDDWKEMIQKNTEHLEIIKAYKKTDGKTSIWTTESFTDIDAAITKGKSLYS